ncbi:MAG: DUF2817 domain-containing protein [Alphaproteobacteria bacterium]|nr:DUF2817 domain-containing protein [Alphaproteobacteria bacterium]
MTDARWVSHSYAEARDRLLAAASGWTHRVWPHPLTGPRGEVLATDTLRFGPMTARRLLVLVSGTHGLEGPVGSAVQLGLVTRGVTLPPDLAVLIVHAINPHGFAWRRRMTEDGVDANRNFVDFSAPLPDNPHYRQHQTAIDPDHWPDVPMTALRIDSAIPTAAHAGQYSHPGGSYFGGHGPTWTNRTMRAILAAEGGVAETIALLDMHSGAGPWAATELFVAEPGASTFAAEWFPGAERFTIARSARFGDPTGVPGLLLSCLPEIFPDRRTLPMLTECGTYPGDIPLSLARREAYCGRKGLAGHPRMARWLLEAQELFCPADPSWRRYALAGVLGRIDQALAALA